MTTSRRIVLAVAVALAGAGCAGRTSARTVPAAAPAVHYSGTTIESTDAGLASALLRVAVQPTARNHRAVAARYLALGIRDSAYDHLLAATRLEPGDAAAFDGLARIWRDWGFPGTGLSFAYRAIALAPTAAYPRNTLGTLLQALGQGGPARTAYERAARLDPAAAYALSNLCVLSMVEHQAAAAIDECVRASLRDPSSPVVTANLALARSRQAAAIAPPSIHITSPLGRTGLGGTIRIVARLSGATGTTADRVSFYVDGALVGTDTDGAPYETPWTDEDPFTPRHLMVEAVAGGVTVRDESTLPPLELTDLSQVTSVTVDASVIDAAGHFLSGVRPSEFELFEDAEPQAIDVVAEEQPAGLFALLIDGSQSMAARAPLLREVASELLEPLRPVDRVIVAPFARAVSAVVGPTADRQTVLDAISSIRPAGGTAILDALQQLAKGLDGQPERRAIVLLTDGYDQHSTTTVEAAEAALRNSGATLYVLGLGGIAGMSLQGEVLLTRLANATGGRAWFPRDDRHVRAAYAAIATDVQHKYLLAYTPRNQRRDGTWREIRVAVQRPGVLVRARAGYTAPAPAPVRASLEFSAVGTGGAAVSLAPSEIVVLEDGVPQAIDTFEEAVLPVTMVLALDASGSMKRSAAAAQAAARDFVAAMRPEDRLGLVAFADDSRTVQTPAVERDGVLRAIGDYRAAGGTALYDALHDSLAQLAAVEGRRVVVVVTDGRDENAASNGPGSMHSWNDVLAMVKQTQAVVYAVGLGRQVDRARLQQLADASGGSAFFPEDAGALSTQYQTILDDLRRRYVVGYQSTNAAHDGGWRGVTITATQPGVRTRSGGGYYAPAR